MEFRRADIASFETEWNNLVFKAADGQNDEPDYYIAHNPSLAKIFQECFGYEPEYYFIYEDDIPLGVLPGVKIDDEFISLPVFPTAGVCLKNKKLQERVYSEIIKRHRRYEIREIIRIGEHCLDTKVNCILKLNDKTDEQFSQFKSKLRSQINKGYKNGLVVKSGGAEYLEEFYRIYSGNMTRIGSPVLSKKLFSELLLHYRYGESRIFIAYINEIPVGCSFLLTYGEYSEVGWASTVKKYNNYNPNMILYWEMIKHAINEKMKVFSFGRATKNSGSHRFKLQWGAEEIPLFFNYSEKRLNIRRFTFLAKLWRILPYKLTLVLGPIIRKKIKI